MKNISAVIIDTYEHKNMAEIAINMMLRLSWLHEFPLLISRKLINPPCR